MTKPSNNFQNTILISSKKALMEAIISLTLEREKEYQKKKLIKNLMQEKREKALQEIIVLKKAG